jgi:hypothetical protein
MNNLQTQGEVEKEDDTTTKGSENGANSEQESEIKAAALAKLNEMAGQEGMGQSTFEGKGIEDKYGFEQDTNDLKKKMYADDDEDDEPKKSEFLKVYKEEETKEAVESTELGEIKLKADDGLQQNPSGKPLVQEMSSTSFENDKA